MRLILEQKVDPVQSAVFLIALRMKRETSAENLGVLQALIDITPTLDVGVTDMAYLADPFDGYTRSLPASPFLPAVLAACGLPTVSQGAESVGPKYGVTHRKVLRDAGIAVDQSLPAIAEQLADPDIGWAYLDQRVSCPKLHELVELRTLIVKRPCLTTLEVLLKPLVPTARSHLITGYVHKPYPPVYTMLARHAGYSSAAIVRGVEGGITPSLQQPAKYFSYHGNQEDQEHRLHPDDVSVISETRAVPIPDHLKTDQASLSDVDKVPDIAALSACSAKLGLAALQGENGPTKDSLVYSGSICLTHCGISQSLKEGAALVREIIDSGVALQRFQNRTKY